MSFATLTAVASSAKVAMGANGAEHFPVHEGGLERHIPQDRGGEEAPRALQRRAAGEDGCAVGPGSAHEAVRLGAGTLVDEWADFGTPLLPGPPTRARM